MNDYYGLKFNIQPFSETASDLLSGLLADIGFESFEAEENGITAYIRAEEYSPAKVQSLVTSFPLPCRLTWNEQFIEGRDWNEEWEKNYFQPVVLGDRCVVHATFHEEYPKLEYDIVIDPKMAFGTGHHATTSMMVGNLLRYDIKGKDVIDMGTGTGILAILAKKLGAKRVDAIEIDPMACRNAKENAALNGCEIEFIQGDARSLDLMGKADIFLANINRNIILADLQEYVKHIKEDGKLMISGFYEKDVPLIERSLNNFGMKIVEKIVEDNWCSLVISY